MSSKELTFYYNFLPELMESHIAGLRYLDNENGLGSS
jgi:hypothetical protein